MMESARFLPIYLKYLIKYFVNYSGIWVETPILRCMRVRSTRIHLKIGQFPPSAEQLQYF